MKSRALPLIVKIFLGLHELNKMEKEDGYHSTSDTDQANGRKSSPSHSLWFSLRSALSHCRANQPDE